MSEELTEKEQAMMEILGKVQYGRISTPKARVQILALWKMEDYGHGGGMKWGFGEGKKFITVISNEPLGFENREVNGGMVVIITAGEAKDARILIKEKE